MTIRFIALSALLVFALPQPATVTLDGLVTQMGNDNPLASVQVRLTSGKPGDTKPIARAVTGTDGLFHISAPPWEYLLMAHRDGYFGPTRYGLPQDSVEQKVTLSVAQQQSTLEMNLIPGGVITGQLLDSTGLPAGKSAVLAMRIEYRNGLPWLRSVESETSNERGEYRLYWIPPGDYVLAYDTGIVSVATATVVNSNGQPGVQMRTFFPGTIDLAKAQAVTVAPGAELRGVNFAIQTSESFSVAGKVLNSFAPPAGPTTSLLELPGFTLVPRNFNGAGNLIMSTFANSVSQADRQQGLFELRGIPSGQYDMFVNVNATSFALNYAARMPIDVTGKSVSGISIAVHPPLEIHGRVVASAGVLLPPKSVLLLLPAENMPAQGISGQRAEIAVDGSFVLKNLIEGTYRIAMQRGDGFNSTRTDGRTENFYIADILQGTQSRLADGIVRLSSAADPLEIKLLASKARISGSVVFPDGKAGTDTTVVLVPDAPLRKNASRYVDARLDDTGKVVLTGIAPGNYRLFAWDGVFATAWLNADFMASYEADGIPITVAVDQEISDLRIPGIRMGSRRNP
jgi:hypothetical protein